MNNTIYILSHSSRQMKVFYSLLSITQERITVGLCVLWDWTMVRGSVIVRRCSQCGLSGHNFSSCSKKNNNDTTTTTIASANYNSNNTSILIGNYNNNNVSVATGNTNNAGRIKIFGVYFQNGDDHDLNKSVSIENQSSKNIENEIEIDAERKKGIIFRFTFYIHIYISVVLYILNYMFCVYMGFVYFDFYLFLLFKN